MLLFRFGVQMDRSLRRDDKVKFGGVPADEIGGTLAPIPARPVQDSPAACHWQWRARPFFLVFPSCPGVAVGSCAMRTTVTEKYSGRRHSLTEMGCGHVPEAIQIPEAGQIGISILIVRDHRS